MILAINTSTPQFSIALVESGGPLRGEVMHAPGSNKFGGLMPAVDDLLKASDTSLRELKGLAVALGPGSFTGLRVGISTAKGLCHGLGIPIMGVSSLEALASQLPHTEACLCPVLTSRKGEIFTALFKWSPEGKLSVIQPLRSLKFEALDTFLEQDALFIGNDYRFQGEAIRAILGARAILAPPALWNLRASSVGSIGLQRYRAGRFDDLETMAPTYLRPPDIRPNPYPLLSPTRTRPLTNKP